MAITNTEYQIRMDAARYLRLSNSGVPDLANQDFLSCQVEWNHPVDLGDRIEFNGRLLNVSKIISRVENGVFVQLLTLTSLKGMSQPYQGNDKIAGCSLNGQIEEIKNDQVKVSLEADTAAGHSPGAPCFFPYSTIYSSKDGSGWYCMPEWISDVLRLLPSK